MRVADSLHIAVSDKAWLKVGKWHTTTTFTATVRTMEADVTPLRLTKGCATMATGWYLLTDVMACEGLNDKL